MQLQFEVSPRELKTILKEMAVMKEPPTTFLWGPPGIGKTEIIHQVAEEIGLPIRVWMLSLMDPIEMKGLLVYDPLDKKADFVPLSIIPQEKSILFLDELPTAPPAVLNTALRMVNEKWLGNQQINPETFIICAGNRLIDKVSPFKLSSAFVNRCIHLGVRTTIDDWTEWAYNNNIRPEVISYFKIAPDDFMREPNNEHPFATPRSWVRVSRLLDSGLSSGLHPLIAGAVGDDVAVRFKTFTDHAFGVKEIIDSILEGSKKSVEYPLAGEAERSYIISTALAQRVNTKREMKLVFNYMFNAPDYWGPFKVVLFRGLNARNISYVKLLDPKEWKILSDWAEEEHII